MKLIGLGMMVMFAFWGAVAFGQSDTTFTYQGELREGSSLVNGTLNMEFSLWDAEVGGALIDLNVQSVPVMDGRFTVELDFGTSFDNSARWLGIEVEGVVLSPRNPITRAPYAIQTRGIFVNDLQNVGIGTTDPEWELDVSGVGRFSDAVLVGGVPLEEGSLSISHDPIPEVVQFSVGDGSSARSLMNMYTASGNQRLEAVDLGVGENFGIGSYTHQLNVKTDFDDNALRLIGPDGSFQHGARINFGDGDLVYFDEDEDDSLTIFSNNRTAIMGGFVGIDTTLPNFRLEVNGTAGKPGGGSWSNSSDRRLKKNISQLQGSLDKLMRLRGVDFEYIDPNSINELEGQRIGMIAQEVEQVFPDWVDQRRDGYKAVTFRGFEALTVEAFRELRKEKDIQITKLKDEKDAEIANLRADHEAEVAELRQRLAELERMVAQLAVAGEEK